MREIANNCSFCSLACPLIIRGGEKSAIFSEDGLLSLDWDTREDSKYGGSLCARGNAIVEFVSHAKRINYPFILGERSSLEAAIEETAKNLTTVKNEFGSDSIGVLIGDNLTNEEAAFALRFAREVLGTENVALFAPDDIPLFRAYLGCDLSGITSIKRKPDGDSEVVLVIGDPLAEHPCTAKEILESKYAARGSEVIVISAEANHSSWFANRHLWCKPGGEAAVAAGLLKAVTERGGAGLPPELTKLIDGIGWNEIERIGGVTKDDLEGTAAAMFGAAKVVTFVSNIFGRIGAPGMTMLFAEAVTRSCPGEVTFTPQFVYQNSWGIYSVLAGAKNEMVLGKLGGDELKALVLLGLDLFSAYPAAPVEKALREKKFTVTTQFFWNQTAARANVVVPAAGLIEKKGTVSPAFGEDLVREDILPPPGGTVTDAEFLTALAKKMGGDLSGTDKVKRGTARGNACKEMEQDWAAYASSIGQLDSAEIVLIPRSEPVHAADGSISKYFHWSQIMVPEPELRISGELALEMKLNDGDTVTVTSEGGETNLTVKTTKQLKGNVVAATIHFPSVRKLFPWKLNERYGEITVAPIPVTISRQSEKS